MDRESLSGLETVSISESSGAMVAWTTVGLAALAALGLHL